MINTEKILIVAGEVSGDLHAAEVMADLKSRGSSVEFFGIGGDKMLEQGLHALYHSNSMAFLGFTEVVKHLPFIIKVKRAVLEFVKLNKIRKALLVDYPGFNLNLARALKKLGVAVYYYISPQIWAWRKGRIKKIRERVDMMMTVFPFEDKMYREAGINSEFVGHPLIEEIKSYLFIDKNELYQKYNLDIKKELLLLLPGSRKQEVERIFPAIRIGALKLAKDFNLQPVVVCASSLDSEYFKNIVNENEFRIVHRDVYSFMKHSTLGIIKSGTSTLEAGLMELPMIVVYKTSNVTYLIGKSVIEIDNIGLVNIVLGKTAMPELIQDELNEKNIYDTASGILDVKVYESMKAELKSLYNLLGTKKASKRVADLLIGSVI